jgi:GGDEF domain-containing protein
MYTTGDEFAILVPNRDEDAALERRAEVEAAGDALRVPHRLSSIYRGASVGAATRLAGETPGQTLGRAIIAMRMRKRERHAESSYGSPGQI